MVVWAVSLFSRHILLLPIFICDFWLTIAILMKYILLSSILVIVIVVIFSKYCNFKYFYFYWHGHPNNTNSTTVSSDDDGSSRKPYEIFGTHYSPLIDECKQRFCVKKIT